jgi:hypothetical protein
MIPSNRHNTESKQYNASSGDWITPPGPRRHHEGYEERFEERQKQEHPNKRQGQGGFRGPAKGPAKRPPSTSTEAWRKYMSGESGSL